jgi:hypothetical protein
MKVTVNKRVLTRGDRIILRGCEILTTTVVEEKTDRNYNVSTMGFDETHYVHVETTDYTIFWFNEYGEHIKCEHHSLSPRRPGYRDRDLDIIGILN